MKVFIPEWLINSGTKVGFILIQTILISVLYIFFVSLPGLVLFL